MRNHISPTGRKIHYLIAMLMLLAASVTAHAQQPLPQAMTDSIVAEGTSLYGLWSRAEMTGKVTVPGLFIRPSARIYMERDSLLSISIRAPFLGEVAVIEATPKSLLAVNKMGRTYCFENLTELLNGMPVTLGNIQDALLSRIFIAGQGTLSRHNASQIELYPDDGGGYIVIPSLQPSTSGFTYGFTTDEDLSLSSILVETTDGNISATAQYIRSLQATAIEASFSSGRREFSLTLSLDAPKWGANPPAAAEVTSRYRKLGLWEFLKSFSF